MAVFRLLSLPVALSAQHSITVRRFSQAPTDGSPRGQLLACAVSTIDDEGDLLVALPFIGATTVGVAVAFSAT